MWRIAAFRIGKRRIATMSDTRRGRHSRNAIAGRAPTSGAPRSAR